MKLLNELLLFTNGNKAELARGLELESRSLINRWEKEGFIPEQYALRIERFTEGQISARHVLEVAERVRYPDYLSSL